MTLLEFARGPALEWSLIIFFAGLLWRTVGSLVMLAKKDLARPKSKADVRNGMTAIATRSLPAHVFEQRIKFQHYTGYAWHIGLFLVLLFYAPHILFFESILGFSWPHLPTGVITIISAITTAILIALLIRRIAHPVQRLISTFDDYFSTIIVIVAMVTGMLAYAHIGARYETLLAWHLLSVEAMLIWFPFGKLMHATLTIPSRYQAGVRFGRRGVKA